MKADDVADGSESSMSAQIIGEGDNIEIAFNVKQKPRRQLAYKISDM